MKPYIALPLALALLVTLAGCAGKKTELTTATKVDNPKEAAAPTSSLAKEPAPPAPATPTPPPAQPAEKPVAIKGGWFKLKSGLEYKDKKPGKGPEAANGQKVIVHYKGWLDSGKVFDTSREREPLPFVIGAGDVIPGWDQGVKGMKPGGVRELNIPSELAYGEKGKGPIPPNARLHFEVELLEIGQ